MEASATTQVHSKETSIPPQSGGSYQTYLKGRDPNAWDRVAALYAILDIQDEKRRLATLTDCRTMAWFARNRHDGHVTVMSNACHLRWCPLCSRSTRIRVQCNTLEFVRSLDRPKFLTLTIKHTEDPLKEQLSHLYKCFSQLRKRPVFATAARGGIFFFQVKLNKSATEWHPHLHVVLDSDYIAHKQLSAAWAKITKGSMVVDIREIKDPEKAADYVARYAATPADITTMPQQKALDLMRALSGRRLCGTWGTAAGLHLLKPEKPIADDWINVGSWTQVCYDYDKDPAARAIFKAWKTQAELPENVSVRWQPKSSAEEPTQIDPEPAVTKYQLPLPYA